MAEMTHTPEHITALKENEVFVFGSNLSGLHLGGAAKVAMKWGAKWGEATGLHGQTYAIPTVGEGAKGTMSVADIRPYVDEFINDAKKHAELIFLVTPIGCGIAGHQSQDIGPLFNDARDIPNIILPKEFSDHLD